MKILNYYQPLISKVFYLFFFSDCCMHKVLCRERERERSVCLDILRVKDELVL